MAGSRRPVWLAGAALVTLVAVCTGVAPAAGRQAPPRPSSYVVSADPGVAPEGIAVGSDGRMYVTSDATGRIYTGVVRDPAMAPFPAPGATERGTSLGVHLDERGRVWSVGGDTLLVHDRDGRLVWQRRVGTGPLGTPYLNDLVITPDAVYVTDWSNARVLRAARGPESLGPLEPWLDMRPAWPGFPAQYWLLNGIVADRTGGTLLVASNGTEAVWRVDTATRQITPVDLGDQSFGADGLVLDGTRLYGVLNYGAPSGVYIAELDATLSHGQVTHRILGDASGAPFQLPTTLAVHQCRILVVNSQADQGAGTPPYTVSAVDDPTC